MTQKTAAAAKAVVLRENHMRELEKVAAFMLTVCCSLSRLVKLVDG
jgi:hypothetical protein